MRTFLKFIFWSTVIFFASCLTAISLSYFSFDMDHHFLKAKQDLLTHTLWVTFFFVHLLFGAIATMAGWPLFFNRLFEFTGQWHKKIGRVYVYSILLFTGPTGLYLSFFAEGGRWATVGFILMSGVWMLFTYRALYWIQHKNVRAHYQWVVRSYCMTLSGVTLRLFMPVGAGVLYWSEEKTFVVSAYLWVLNVMVGELIVFFNRNKIPSVTHTK